MGVTNPLTFANRPRTTKKRSLKIGCCRLLNYSKNVWMHLNCILWSNEVYEARDGSLVNVPQMCKRAQDTVRMKLYFPQK